MPQSKNPRLAHLRRKLRGTDALFITHLPNVRYLTGFTGSAGYVALTKAGDFFVTDFRYQEQASREVSDLDVRISRQGFALSALMLMQELSLDSIALEDTVMLRDHLALASKHPVKPLRDLVQSMREVKDDPELSLIKKAIKRAEAAFKQIKPLIKPGATERSISLALEEAIKAQGSERLPFELIVASGPNSALPHARAAARKLCPGDLLTIDWGAEAGGYFSDMTRSFLIKGPEVARKKEIYNLVLRANRAAMKMIAPGVQARLIDESARGIIREAGYGEYFGHGLGHGVGLEVHEGPRIGVKCRHAVKAGMVFTVEPGIYVPELGGVRIEDMALVTEAGVQELTSLPRGLEILG